MSRQTVWSKHKPQRLNKDFPCDRDGKYEIQNLNIAQTHPYSSYSLLIIIVE